MAEGESNAPNTHNNVLRPLLIAVPTWLLATLVAGPVGSLVAMTGAMAGPHRPLLESMRGSRKRLAAATAPALHLILMTFSWTVPFLWLDIRRVLTGIGPARGLVPHVVVLSLTVIAGAALALLEDHHRIWGEMKQVGRDAYVFAAYCMVQIVSIGVIADLLRRGAAKYPNDSSDASFLMFVFPVMAYYILLISFRAYLNRGQAAKK